MHGREETKVSQGDRGRRIGGTERERREEKTRVGVWKKGKFGKTERQKKTPEKALMLLSLRKTSHDMACFLQLHISSFSRSTIYL